LVKPTRGSGRHVEGEFSISETDWLVERKGSLKL